jgi:hypothetical protein
VSAGSASERARRQRAHNTVAFASAMRTEGEPPERALIAIKEVLRKWTSSNERAK